MCITEHPSGRQGTSTLYHLLKIVLACGFLLAMATTAVLLHRVRAFEKMHAEEMEADFRQLSSGFLSATTFRPARLVGVLTNFGGAAGGVRYHNRELTERVEAARQELISNVIVRLETNSGMHYGTNIQAWQDWLASRSSGL